MLRTVTGRLPVTVMVIGCEETLPLDPLKLSAVVESLMLLFCAHAGLAISIAARERRMWFFNTTAPGDKDGSGPRWCRSKCEHIYSEFRRRS